MNFLIFPTMELGRRKQPGAIHSPGQKFNAVLTIKSQELAGRKIMVANAEGAAGVRRRLWDVRLVEMTEHQLRLRGFEAVEGVSYAQEWHCDGLYIIESPLGEPMAPVRPCEWCQEAHEVATAAAAGNAP